MMNIRRLSVEVLKIGRSADTLHPINVFRCSSTPVKIQTCLLSVYPKYHHKYDQWWNRPLGQESKKKSGRNFWLIRGKHTKQENGREQPVTSSSTKLWIILGTITAVGISWYARKNYSSCEEKVEETKLDESRKKGKLNQISFNGASKITIEEAIEKSRDVVQRIKDETGGPGIVVAVSVDGQEVWSEGFGYADVENRTLCTPDTVLRIASISKPIAMVTVARLWESGQLDIDKPVQYYIPKFPEKTVDGEKVVITTRQLMSHLSGIRHYNKDYMKKNKNQQNKEVKEEKVVTQSDKEKPVTVVQEVDQPEHHIKKHYGTVEESMSLFKDDPLVHKPGSKYLYTTHGFTLLSGVVEAVMKKPFEKLIRELIRELGLSHTYLDENDPLIYNRGRHYVKNKRGRLVNAPYVDLSYKWAGGGLISTASDVVKFGNIMLYSYQNRKYSTVMNDGKNINEGTKDKNVMNTNKSFLPGILKSETVNTLWTAVDKTESEDKERSYGMGWELVTEKHDFGNCRKRRFVPYHTGGAQGGSSVLVILPPDSEEFIKEKQPPVGVCVGILINMASVGLTRTALEIATLFERTKD